MGADLLGRLLCATLVVVPRDADVEPIDGEADGRRTANPRIETRDNRNRPRTSIAPAGRV